MAKVNLLGVKIDDITLNQASKTVEDWIIKGGKYYIVTPNPEFLVLAQTDTEFKKILNSADLAIPDGRGLIFSGKVKNTVAGIDLMVRLISLSEEKGFTIGLIGGFQNLADKTAECLNNKYPKLNIVVIESNFRVNNYGKISENVTVKNNNISQNKSNYIICRIDELKNQNIDILFVAFGQVKQEKWIYNNLPELKVKVAMGVGGAFDYLSGNIPRAPKWLRNPGLEWLFRLIVQPWRIKRQLNLLKYLWLLATS